MATATQPKSSSAAVDVQNVAVENLSLESNSGKKASKWGLSKVFTTAFRRPSLGALSTSLPAANSEGEGVGTRVSTSTPPLAVKDTLALTASAQEVPSAPTDTDARPDDSAGWVVRTGDDSSSSNGSEAASSDDDYDGELSPLPQKELSERRRDDTPLRLKGAPGSEYNHNDEGGDEVVIAKDTPPHVSANAGDANDRDGYEAWSTPPPRNNPVPSRLPSLDQSPGTLMGTRSSSSRRGSTTGSSTASGEAAPEVISRGSGVVVDDSADQDGQCGHDGDDDDDDEGEDRVVRVLLGRDESTARGLSRVTEGSREYASVSSVRSARFDSSSSSRGGNIDSSRSPSRRGSSSSGSSSSSSGGSSFLGRESSAMRGLSASVERGSATAGASTPAGGSGGIGGASGEGKGGSSSADKAKDTNSRNSQSESRALSLSRANPTGDARTDGRRSPFVPHKPEGSAAAAALFDATRPSGGDERWEDRSGADHVSNSNSSSASSSSSSVNLASDLAAEEGRGNGTGDVEHTRAEEGNERSWSDDDDDRVVVLNDQLFPSNNDEDDDDDDDRAHRYAFHDLSSRSPRREKSQPRERRSDEREDRSASGSEGIGAFVFGRNGGRTHSSSSDEEDEDGRDRGGGSAAEVGAGGEGIGTFRRRGGDDNAWDCDDVGRDALSSDEGELEEEDGVDEDAASAAAAAQAAVKTLLSDTSLTVAQKMATLKTQHANGDLESIGGANALTSASQLLHAAPHLSKAADDGDLAVPAVEDDALGQTSNDRNVGDGNDEGEERERSEAFGEGEELIVAASSSSSEEENEEEEDEDAMIARMEAEYEAANASSSRWLGESSSSSSGGGGNLRELQQHDDDEEEALRALLASEAAANAPPEGSASPNSYSSGSGGNEVSGGEEGGEEGAWAGPPAAGKGAFFNEESDIEGEGDGDENSSDREGSPSHGGGHSTEEGEKGRRRPRNGGEEERGDHHDDDGFGSTEEEEEEESELGVLQSVNSSRAGNSSNLDQSRSNGSSNISSNERMGRSSPGDASRISPPPPPRSASADTAASGAGNDRPRNSSSSDRDPRSRSLSYGSTKLEPQPARTSIPLEISSGEEDGLVDDSTEWEDDGDGAGLQNFSQGAGSAFERYRVQHVGSSSAGVSASGSSSSGLVVLSDSASVGGESSDDEIQGADGGAANAGGEGLGGYWAVLALICPGTRQEQEPPRSSYQEQPSLDWDGESSDGPDSENDDDDDDEGGSTRGSRFAFGGLGPVGQSRSDNPGRPSRGGANSFLGGCLPPPQQPQHRSGGGFVWPWQRTARS